MPKTIKSQKGENNGHYKHGGKGTKLYEVWCSMKRRCELSTLASYKYYGGRGISVCSEWKESFIAFRKWAFKNGYKEGLSLDRIDNNGNYEPSNNIFERLKRIEWRTKPMPTGKHYCYETKKCLGVGKVIGEFRIWRIKKYENISFIPEVYITQGCVPIEFLEEYSKGRPLYAHFIIDPKRYDKPKELSEFEKPREYIHINYRKRNSYFKGITRPPQSWCYVEGSDNNA